MLGHHRCCLSDDSTKESRKGTGDPHVFPVLLESESGQALRQSVRKHYEYLHSTFDKFHMTVSNQVTEKVYLDIDMS